MARKRADLEKIIEELRGRVERLESQQGVAESLKKLAWHVGEIAKRHGGSVTPGRLPERPQLTEQNAHKPIGPYRVEYLKGFFPETKGLSNKRAQEILKRSPGIERPGTWADGLMVAMSLVMRNQIPFPLQPSRQDRQEKTLPDKDTK